MKTLNDLQIASCKSLVIIDLPLYFNDIVHLVNIDSSFINLAYLLKFNLSTVYILLSAHGELIVLSKIRAYTHFCI